MTEREYPKIEEALTKAVRPISFVCVRFSDEYDHNLATCDVVHDPMNQFILVDNSQNLHFPTLGAAIRHGIAQAKHDLIAVVHEDVVLPDRWQDRFEASLTRLERYDPNWLLLGAVGWQGKNLVKGHWSDPHKFRNTFEARPFETVLRLDEQLLILRKSGPVDFDAQLPSIHFIGRDIANFGRQCGLRSYAVNAPTIHKYKDASGQLILGPNDSRKIVNRKSQSYLADHSLSEDYFTQKWALARAPNKPLAQRLSAEQMQILRRPVILVGRGGGGTRLVSTLAQDCGLFIGNNVSVSGDCLDMVHAMYRAVLTKYQYNDSWLRFRALPDLLNAACDMLDQGKWPEFWGFKLPETALMLPEIRQAFPDARYVYFSRSLENTIFRRTHMTARLDNHIGRCTLPLAYDFFGYDRKQILTDSALMHMATTTLHQTALIKDHLSGLAPDRHLHVTFEDTVSQPGDQLDRLAKFLKTDVKSRSIVDQVDPGRAKTQSDHYSEEEIAAYRKELPKLEARMLP